MTARTPKNDAERERFRLEAFGASFGWWFGPHGHGPADLMWNKDDPGLASKVYFRPAKQRPPR